MGQLSFTPIVDGTTADASDINTPLTSIQSILNGGVESDNLADQSVTNAKLETSIRPETRFKETLTSFVYSGGTIATSGTLGSTVAACVAYVNGKRLSVSAYPKTFTASKDTYVDLKDDGTYAFVEVTNGATSGMTLTTNSDGSNALRIAKVVTSGSAVTSVVQYWIDALGNYIYNTSPTARPITPYSTGGTFYYRNQSGVKEFWGVGNPISITTTSVAGAAITLPAGFFNAITLVNVTAIPGTDVGALVNINNVTSTTLNLYAFNYRGSTSTCSPYIYIRGA